MSAKHIAFPVLWRRLSVNGKDTGKDIFSSVMKPEMTEISRSVLPVVKEALCTMPNSPFLTSSAASSGVAQTGWKESETEDGVALSMRVGRLRVPLTLLGSVVPSAWEGRRDTKEWKVWRHPTIWSPKEVELPLTEMLAIHSAGLPGAVLVSLRQLLECRADLRPLAWDRTFTTDTTSAPAALGAACLVEAIARHADISVSDTCDDGEDDFLDAFYRLGRRRHFSLLGLERMMAVSERLHVEALDCSFPYHCGGNQARKEYFDVQDDVLSLYGPHFRHGVKVLSRYGLSTCLGVRPEDSLGGLPAVYWHPSGAPAACMAPLLHSCRSVAVGRVELVYNGPTAACSITQERDATTVGHYVKVDEEEPKQKRSGDTGVSGDAGVHEEQRGHSSSASRCGSASAPPPPFPCDTTDWLTMSLFGLKPHTTAWSGRKGRALGPLLGRHATTTTTISSHQDNGERHTGEDPHIPRGKSGDNGTLVVHGTHYNSAFGEFEMCVRDTKSAMLYLAADV